MEESKQKVEPSTQEIQEKIIKYLQGTGWDQELRFWWGGSELRGIIDELKKKVHQNERWLPGVAMMYRFLREVPYDKVRVMMIIDDPSNIIGYNTGVPCHIDPIDKSGNLTSLKGSQIADNMLWSLGVEREYRSFNRKPWWKQGVLMVPLAQSVRLEGAAHYKLHEPFLMRLLEKINIIENVPVLLIGRKTWEYEDYLTTPHIRKINPRPWHDLEWYDWVNSILREQKKKEIIWR